MFFPILFIRRFGQVVAGENRLVVVQTQHFHNRTVQTVRDVGVQTRFETHLFRDGNQKPAHYVRVRGRANSRRFISENRKRHFEYRSGDQAVQRKRTRRSTRPPNEIYFNWTAVNFISDCVRVLFQIKKTLAPECDADGTGSFEATNSFFIERVRNNLHFVLCFSPVEKSFRCALKRARFFFFFDYVFFLFKR